MSDLMLAALRTGNLFLASVNVIVAFSLLAYIASHNFRSPVARGFCALITFVLIVFAGDVILANVNTLEAAALWLHAQWLGIAFVPAAYLHLSDALLRTTGVSSPWRRAAVAAGYVLGAFFFLVSAFTGWLIHDGVQSAFIFHFRAGPLIWAFALYYFAATAWGVYNIQLARSRCLTSTSRRRMTYLALAFAAPGLGVFPYLLSATMSHLLSLNGVLILTLVGNMAVVLMTIVIGYIVAYQGVLLPDRVIKHSMVHYILRGPLVGSALLVLILITPSVERILGVPRDTFLIFAIVLATVLFQVAINLAKPAIDRLIYRKDRAEITWIQELDKHLLTSTDIEQIVENTLVALCDLLRTRSGFIVTLRDNSLHLQVFSGPREKAAEFLSRSAPSELAGRVAHSRQGPALTEADFVACNGYALLPLRSRDRKTILGILGVEQGPARSPLSHTELETVDHLVQRAESALDDMRLQQEIFALLRRMEPEIEQLQRWGSTPRYAQPGLLEAQEASLVHSPSLAVMVKDALSHYWGGPKLSRSPLLGLRVVQQALAANDGVPAKALRAVLREAIERLRPDTERSPTASEWVVYNILDYKYLRGDRIRDIASRMAMSESDYYRKQRIAIEEVAKALAAMEESAAAAEAGGQGPPRRPNGA
jgi:DNA-binding Xre family transcriptional regulator